MTTPTGHAALDCRRLATPFLRCVGSKALGIFALIALALAIYAFGYFLVRHSHRTVDGRMVIGTGSRYSDRLFAPMIALEKHVGERPAADPETVLASVLAEARSSHRAVLVSLGTRKCLPCRQLERFLQEQQAILAKYFVVMKAEQDGEMTLGALIRDRYREPRMTDRYTEYFPWILFLGANGEVLMTADDGPEGLIGIPQGGPQDRAWFLQMLRIANPAITDDELSRLDAAAAAYHQLIWRDVVPRDGHHE